MNCLPRLSRTSLLAAGLLLGLSSPVLLAAKKEPAKDAAEQSPADAEAARAAKAEERTNEILKALNLSEKDKAKAVHDLILAQYSFLHAWQQTNEARLKDLKKASHDQDKAVADKATADLAAVMQTRKSQHDSFLTSLATQLTPEQIEIIKDKLTYGKVAFTYQGYMTAYPDLPEGVKAQILSMLKDAREEAMDGVSADEKTDIFSRCKGKINNYLSKQGISKKKDDKKASS